MQDLFSSNNNFEQYRVTLQQSAPPSLPCFSLIMKEISNLEMLMLDTVVVEEKIYINIEKMTKFYELAHSIDLYKQPYNLGPVDIIYQFLTRDLIFLGDDILFDKSKEIEKVGEETGVKSVLNRESVSRTRVKSILIKEKEKSKKNN